ncbi:hypothetical protein R1sor_004658 [Riccia sorocarpa]|uniref:Uncharacterized protein n=1 Tax=Riccia sorocarpa TaxID=122646 RepID=A0ABD3HHK5_9MARC
MGGVKAVVTADGVLTGIDRWCCLLSWDRSSAAAATGWLLYWVAFGIPLLDLGLDGHRQPAEAESRPRESSGSYKILSARLLYKVEDKNSRAYMCGVCVHLPQLARRKQ